MSLSTQLRADHDLLVRHAFYPLVATSALACALFVVRALLTGTMGFRFMNWNLILAWLPYLCALLIARIHKRRPGRWVRLLPLGVVWLLFFPNAPYIMTDFVHLIRAGGALWWYDLGLIAAYAWAGCFLAVASLWAMHDLVRDYCGAIGGWLFALTVVGLAGIGIYLGRFARINSWDIFTSPRLVARHLRDALTEPHALGASALFAALLLMFYLFFNVRRTSILPRHAVRHSCDFISHG